MRRMGFRASRSNKRVVLAAILWLAAGRWLAPAAFAGQTAAIAPLQIDLCSTISETDGSPSNATCGPLLVPNGSLTDNGDGTYGLVFGSGSAPTDATYLTQTANGTLTNEQALDALSTGMLRVATATGVLTSLTDSAGIAANLSDETGTGALVLANSPVLTTPNIGSATGSISGNAATVTTNANLTGPITSVGNATSIASQTGTGTMFVMNTSPTLVTPALGAATATSLNTLIPVAHGANPTIDAAGKFSIDTSATSGSAFTFYGDTQYTMPGWQTISFPIDTPTASSDYPLRRFTRPVTIRAINGAALGGTNVVFGLDEADANALNGVAIDTDITCTTNTACADDGTLTNPSLDANDWLLFHTTSVSGSVTSITVTVWWTFDAVN